MSKKKKVVVQDSFYGCESGCTGVRTLVDGKEVGFNFDCYCESDWRSKKDFIINIASKHINLNEKDYEIDVDGSDLQDGGLDW